ncbi:MAG: acyltransferase [Candidatus Hydrogenedentes bacterium]|nr:acyltransferase [Candidatus Hydrogenedentota bacterium]
MDVFTRTWRNWRHSRKFAKLGKGCRFLGRDLELEGHVELGDFCRVREAVKLRARPEAKIVIGDRCLLSWNVIIEAGELVEIHDQAGLAEYSIIRDGTHLIYGTEANWRYTPNYYKPIIIEESAWIGSGAYISKGVRVGKGAVIGVGSVVTCDVPPFEVWVGAPARFLRHRTVDLPEELEKLAQRLIQEQGIKEDRREY